MVMSVYGYSTGVEFNETYQNNAGEKPFASQSRNQ